MKTREIHQSWWMAGCVAAAALTVYVVTLAPGLTWANYGADGGDLIAAARTLGVPHPSGYPAYTLLAWLFTQLPIGVIAYRVNLLSAVCAAAAVAWFFLTAQRLLPTAEHPLLLPTATALTLAFSSLLWSQAVISEVYALLLLFAALLLWLLVRWREGGGDRFLWLAALVLGLGLGNHLTLIFVVPAALVLFWPERAGGRGGGRADRASGVLGFARTLARAWLPAVGLFLAGLSVYAYLPLAARHRPPVNWGNPQTWQGFLWVVTGRQYQAFAFGIDPAEIPNRITRWAALLGDQFGWWGLAIALVGLWGWWRRDRRFTLFAAVWILLLGVYAFFYKTGDSHVYLLPAVLLMALWWGEGAGILLGQAHRLWSKGRTRLPVGRTRLPVGRTRLPVGRTRLPVGRTLALAVLILLPLGSLALHWREAEPDDDWQVHAYIDQVLDAVEPGGLIIVSRDRPTFALWYGLYAEERRPDVAVVNGPMLAFIWYRDHVRHLYPDLVLHEPTSQGVTIHDLVHDLVVSNFSQRAVYATDPREEWEEWFRFVQVGESPVYRVQSKPPAGP